MEHGCSYGMRMSPEHLQLSIRIILCKALDADLITVMRRFLYQTSDSSSAKQKIMLKE